MLQSSTQPVIALRQSSSSRNKTTGSIKVSGRQVVRVEVSFFNAVAHRGIEVFAGSNKEEAGSIQLATTAALADMYEPNQFVMNCGIVDPTAGPIRFSSPISRNLNDGDAIVLLVRHTLAGPMDIRGTCRYAITLQ